MRKIVTVILSALIVILCCVPMPIMAQEGEGTQEEIAQDERTLQGEKDVQDKKTVQGEKTAKDEKVAQSGESEVEKEVGGQSFGEDSQLIPQLSEMEEMTNGHSTKAAEAVPSTGVESLAAGQSAEEAEVSHQPRILVTSQLPENALKAGSTTSWAVTVKNCSKTEAIENVKVTLTAEGQDVTLEKASWYFEKIGANKTIDLSQNISVGKKAAQEPVTLQFQFEYEDKRGNGYTCTEPICLPIRQEQQAELVNLSFAESAYASDTEPFTFQVDNTGLATLYNVRVRLTGPGLFPTKDLFLGNMEAGASEDGEIPVFIGTLDMDENGDASGEGEKYGETSAVILFSYENEQGEVQEQRMEVHTEIKEPKQVKLKVEKEVPQTNQWWISIVVLAAIVLLSVIVWLYLRMKHFKKRVMLYEKA